MTVSVTEWRQTVIAHSCASWNRFNEHVPSLLSTPCCAAPSLCVNQILWPRTPLALTCKGSLVRVVVGLIENLWTLRQTLTCSPLSISVSLIDLNKKYIVVQNIS